MGTVILELLFYTLRLFLLTLLPLLVCGLAVYLLSRLFVKLWGNGAGTMFDMTSLIGTPIHELGHASMCFLFGHRITKVKLFSLRPKNGVYGYVEHSYNRKNPWARLGNIFIAAGPLFSGLGVIALMLFLCFPDQWANYLAALRASMASGVNAGAIFSDIFSLLVSLPHAFTLNWLPPTIGLLVILSVSLHVTLSPQDLRSAATGLPMYLFMITVFALATFFAGVRTGILSAIWLFDLCTLSIFSLVIAFSALWVLIALLVRAVRAVISWF